MPAQAPPKPIEKDTEKFALTATSIQLDSNGNLPTRIPLFVTGDWPNSIKGNFEVDLDDLKQMKSNFDNKVGFPTDDASTGLAIDFAHNYADEAAGWFKGLELEISRDDPTKGTLYANPVEWTDAGATAIQSGRFKCISPMGAFGKKDGKLSMWSNPNNLKETVPNVIEGAGLTNIPFLRGMSPIRADKLDDSDSGYGNLMYVAIEQHKKEHIMPELTLDSLRNKERNELSVPELDFLVENKEELSAVERQKFQLEEAAGDEEDQLSEEDKSLLAAIKAGDKQVVNKDELSADQKKISDLEKTALDYRTEKAEQVVKLHIERGAIKQDANDFWTKQLLSVEDEARENLEAQLEALPSNDQLAKEIGSSDDTAAGSTTREQLDALANAEVEKATKDGKTLLYGDALKQVMAKNPELTAQDKKEQLTGVK